MYKKTIVFALSILVQGALSADEAVPDGAGSSKATPEIITPTSGSQYNLEGMKTDDGRYKSSYSTKSVDTRDPDAEPAPNPYGANGVILPVAPVIVITDD